jgi:hypothetical protein
MNPTRACKNQARSTSKGDSTNTGEKTQYIRLPPLVLPTLCDYSTLWTQQSWLATKSCLSSYFIRNLESMLWSQFSAIFDDFRQKIGGFFKNQCYDQNFALFSFILSQKRQYFCWIFRRKYLKNHNVGPWSCPSWLNKKRELILLCDAMRMSILEMWLKQDCDWISGEKNFTWIWIEGLQDGS